MLTIGIDLGGTNIKAGIIDAAGMLLAEASAPTGLPCTAEEVCDRIAALVEELLHANGYAKSEISAIGVGCPGTVEPESGMVLYSNNLAWENFAMRSYLESKTALPVVLGNDANVAALGEAAAGCAKGAQSAIILTLGTGVGGGVVLDGKLWTGFTGAAAEPGHIVIHPEGEKCTCGRRGCLEAYASATALIRESKRAIEKRPESLLARLAFAQNKVDGRLVFDAAAQGDAAAKEVVAQYIRDLSLGVADLINIFYPEVIGFSGGIAKQGETLLAPLRAAVEPQVFGAAYAKKKTRLVCCTLGYRAGVIGAAILAEQAVERKA